jgi:cation-transporting ATPase 13A1
MTLIHQGFGLKSKIKRKFPFSSALKRMSVVAEISNVNDNKKISPKFFVFTKGAPELILKFLKIVPSFYTATYCYHMSRGKRVLAIAYKELNTNLLAIDRFHRGEMESELIFAGFLVFDCDLKVDSKSVIKELKNSNHSVVMITGDSVYTAADVARKLNMFRTNSTATTTTVASTSSSYSVLVLHAIKLNSHSSKLEENGFQLVWRKIDESDVETEKMPDDIDFNLNVLSQLKHSGLCVTGTALQSLEKTTKSYYENVLKTLCPFITVFARVSPTQKESIVIALNEAGLFTLMCGDGTNDVGALKAAHVGVSIVNDPEFEKKIESAKDPTTGNKSVSSKDRMARAMMELQEQETDPTIVKLGDASIASPFTARRTSIDSVLTVIRQGRCTLVTTIQVSFFFNYYIF